MHGENMKSNVKIFKIMKEQACERRHD